MAKNKAKKWLVEDIYWNVAEKMIGVFQNKIGPNRNN